MTEATHEAATKGRTLNIAPDLLDKLKKKWHHYCDTKGVDVTFGVFADRAIRNRIIDCAELPELV